MLCKECCDRVSGVKSNAAAGQCKFAWGCKRLCQRVGRVSIGLCKRHVQFLIDSAALTGKQDILKRDSVRVVKPDTAQVADSGCAYIYREKKSGYEPGDSCQIQVARDSQFCKYHTLEVEATEVALKTLKDSLSWYLQSDVFKKSLSRVTTQQPNEEVVNTPKSREELCRTILERLTGKPFPKSRPSWLRHQATNRLLELDGYCKELQVAFEHDGAQHHDPNAAFAGSKEDFKKQQERDVLKSHYCQENGVKLIRVPYDMPVSKIEEYLVRQLPASALVTRIDKSVEQVASSLSSTSITPGRPRELKTHRSSKPPKDKQHLYQKTKMSDGGYVWVLKK